MRYINWDKEILSKTIEESKSFKETLTKLGIIAAGGNYRTLHRYIKRYELNTSHFEVEKIRLNNLKKLHFENKTPLINVLVENSNFSRTHLKKRLYGEGLKKRCCELCGQGEEWQGKKMSLILDHINGVRDDNRLENLRIVCPNCNATLDTHCGKNTKSKISNTKTTANSPRYKNIEKKMCQCGNIKSYNGQLCRKCYNTGKRKVERPSLEELLKEVEKMGYSATGRKYGVSDNAIRKWIKSKE